jgi:hypothetical protein
MYNLIVQDHLGMVDQHEMLEEDYCLIQFEVMNEDVDFHEKLVLVKPMF